MAARTKGLDFSTPEAERATLEALALIAAEYGRACNLMWSGSEHDRDGIATFAQPIE